MNNNTFVNFDCYNWNKMINSFKALKTLKKDEGKDHVYIRICDTGVKIYRVNTVDYVTRQCFYFTGCTVNNFDNNIYYCYKLKTSDFMKAVSEDIYQCVMVLSDNELRFINGDNNKNITVEKTKEDPETVNSNYKFEKTSVYFSVLTEDLKEVFNRVTWMLPADNVSTKSVKGVCFQFEDNDAVIRITGTNGHILLSDTVDITTNRYPFGNIQEFIIPQKNIKIMQNLIKNHKVLKFDVSENHVYISDKGMFVSFELLPEKYPKYKQLQVKDTDSQITLNSNDVLPILKETKQRVVSIMPVSAGKMIDFSDIWTDVLRCNGAEVKAIMSGNLYNFYITTECLKGLFKNYKQVTFQNNKKSYAHNILITNRIDFIGILMGCIA